MDGAIDPAAGGPQAPLALSDLPRPLQAPVERYCSNISGLADTLREAGFDEAEVEQNVLALCDVLLSGIVGTLEGQKGQRP